MLKHESLILAQDERWRRLRGLEQKEPFSFLPIMTERQWAV